MPSNTGRAIAGGVAGTLVMSGMMYMVAPMMGAGFFSANAGGAMAAMGSLVGHVLYGAVLGAASGTPALAVARA